MSIDSPVLGGPGQLRPLEHIFPLRGDASRGREMQATWRSFCRDRLEAVRAVLDAGRSAPEIAYQLGELLHNHFRTRGVTLTSYELRRLVTELTTLGAPASAAPEAPAAPLPAAAKPEAGPSKSTPVVAFEREPKAPWPGDMPPSSPSPAPKVPDEALEPPPSPIVTVAPKDGAPKEAATLQEASPVERPFAPVVDLAKDLAKNQEERAPDAAVDEAVIAPAPSETADPSLIDRLWSDSTVKALFVNGPTSVAVERDGAVQMVSETFRDEAHLLESVTRLVGEASGMADFRLRDGSTGFVIFPPAAPAGPVLTLRRGEPGKATLEVLVSVGMIDPPVAELLRLCVRAGLSVLVSGPSGSGKTALLAALIRDLDPALRVVTVADHREFRWPSPAKVELVGQATAPFGMLMAAATRLEPSLMVLDGVPVQDTAALAEQLRGPAGIVASIASETMLLGLARVADVVVRTDRVDGQARVVAVEDCAGTAAFALEEGRLARGKPAFAATLQSRGLGDSLTKLLG